MNEPRPLRILRAILAFAFRCIHREKAPGVPGVRVACCFSVMPVTLGAPW
ncbi:hypothetical protein JCM33774_88390 [Actinophytocola sp. KF-1]